ncbi:hypothetical protein A3K63_02585 [Candidatus Micrarchaeota archaeon RBG_16_49_10]|nr:MAG: hypothetical protein A3K63_02585 [Candidatus Micrarchaeota archaeon RBG_16_49_10]
MIFMAFVGLIEGVIISLVGYGMMGFYRIGMMPMMGANFGVLAILVFPLVFSVAGFICGALGGFISNLALKITGGLKIELSAK